MNNLKKIFLLALAVILAVCFVGLATWFFITQPENFQKVKNQIEIYVIPEKNKPAITDLGVEEVHEMGTIEEKPINEKYSYQDFTHQSFRNVPAEEFNNTTIIGTSFYQENEPYKRIFPDDIQGVIFKRCNLDNVYVPQGNIIEGGTHQQVQIQNDLDDWLVDQALNPIEPINKEQRLEAGVSIDPKDIPRKKFTAQERREFEEKLFPKLLEDLEQPPEPQQLEELFNESP